MGYDDDYRPPRRFRLGEGAQPVHIERDVNSITLGELLATSRDLPHTRRVNRAPLRERLAADADAIEAAIELLALKLARRRAQLRTLEIWPDEDPFENGTHLEFVKVFPNSDKEYPYAALRANDRWFLTGERSPNNITWAQFVDWCGVGVTEVHKVGAGRRTKVIG